MLNQKVKRIWAIQFAIYLTILSTGLMAIPVPVRAQSIPCPKKDRNRCYHGDSVVIAAQEIKPGSSVIHTGKQKPKPAPTPPSKQEPPKKAVPERRIICKHICALDGPIELPTQTPKQKPKPAPPPKKQTPIPPQIIEMVKELPLEKPVLTIEPYGEALVNVPEIGFTKSPPTQTLHSELFGRPVIVKTTVIDYAWEWGEGTITHSDEPGKAYPDESVTHTYTMPGKYTLRLTTTIKAIYINPDGVEQEIPGTTTLTSAPQFLTVKEEHSVLISNPGENN